MRDRDEKWDVMKLLVGFVFFNTQVSREFGI
jgi:hypothetical protein